MAMAAWWPRDNVESVYEPEQAEAAEPHEKAWRFGERLHDEQGEARRALADAALFFMYGSGRSGLRGSALAAVPMQTDPPFRNVVRKCVNSKTALIFRNKVRCYFLTDGADVEDQEKALGMTRAVEAQFAAAGIYGIQGYRICQDGQLFDGGVAKVVADVVNNRVLIERVFPWEIYVSLEESRTGTPRQYGHRQLVERSVLAAMFPEFKKEIAAAPNAPDDWKVLEELSTTDTSDLVAVWELWHLPSGRVDLEDKKSFGLDKDGKFRKNIDPGHDGRHAIVLEQATLVDRPYPFEYPPLAFYLPQPDPVGFWSLSLPESLQGIQLELIKLGKRMQSIMHLHAVPRLAVDRRAKVNTAKLTNDIADIVEVNGSPAAAVQYLAPNAVPAQLFQREKELDDEALRESGISELTAYAQKPPGIDHAPPLEHLADTESVRHTPAHRGWEEFHLQLGRATVDAFRLLAEHNKKFSLIWGDDEELQIIDWTNVDLGRGKYLFRAWPTNLLASTPTAKLNQVLTALQQGLMADTPEAARARALLNFPDTRGAFGDPNVVPRRIAKLLDQVEKEGLTSRTMPSPFNKPGICLTMAEERINKREGDWGPTDPRIDGLRDFHDAARRVSLRMKAEEAQAAQGIIPPGAGGPPANQQGRPTAPAQPPPTAVAA